MRDGVELIADRYFPDPSRSAPQLVRTPYGRGFPLSAVFGGMFAASGLPGGAAERAGASGSGGDFGSDRQRSGRRCRHHRLGCASSLGNPEHSSPPASPTSVRRSGALLTDPPRIWRARSSSSATTTSPGELGHRRVRRQRLPAVELLRSPTREDPWRPSDLPAAAALRVIERTCRPGAVGGRRPSTCWATARPWWEGWFERGMSTTHYWDRHVLRRTGGATVPVLLVGGWQDVFPGPDHRAIPPAVQPGGRRLLTIGPWTHDT